MFTGKAAVFTGLTWPLCVSLVNEHVLHLPVRENVCPSHLSTAPSSSNFLPGLFGVARPLVLLAVCENTLCVCNPYCLGMMGIPK